MRIHLEIKRKLFSLRYFLASFSWWNEAQYSPSFISHLYLFILLLFLLVNILFKMLVFPSSHAIPMWYNTRNILQQSVPLADYPHTPTHNGGTWLSSRLTTLAFFPSWSPNSLRSNWKRGGMVSKGFTIISLFRGQYNMPVYSRLPTLLVYCT